jgi:multicomponent Na+:H+ antiporter subunit B
MNRRQASSLASGAVVLILASMVLAPVVLPDIAWPTKARDMLAAHGYDDTGASNLVSAIYLGYRAYDTLGETVVLLAALAGAVALTSMAHRSPVPAGSISKPQRTEIMDVIAGKLAPVVLLFGTYVMLYGHVSPGGGFQGGVVLASGIIFIALGRRSGGVGRMEQKLRVFSSGSLARIEGIAFAAILIFSFAGLNGSLEATIEGASGGLLALPPVAYIIALNMAIGLKVGSGVALMCIIMMGGTDR